MAINSLTSYGERLNPQILDSLASTDPGHIVYSIASFSNNSHDIQHISACTFAKAVDKTAWWLHNQVRRNKSVQMVGYIGPHDIRRILLTYACVKTSCTALSFSPKNSTEGVLAVLKAAKCTIWVKPCEQLVLPIIRDFLQQHSMTFLDIPEIDELLDSETTEPYPYDKTFDKAIQEPFCLPHISRSAGLPKPTSRSHGLIGAKDAVRLLPPIKGNNGLAPRIADWKEGDRIYSSFTMSHGTLNQLRK